MKFLRFTVLVLACLISTALAQEDADSRYIAIYNAIQSAEGQMQGGQMRTALAGFSEALTELQQFQKSYPAWDPGIVTFRLSDLQKKIVALNTVVSPKKVPPSEAVLAPVKNSATEPAPELVAQLQAAQQQVQSLQAKLKEALAMQPAMVSVTQLTAAQEQIRTLTKQNELLKAVQGTRVERVVVTDTNELAKLRLQLADAETKLAGQQAQAQTLADELAALKRKQAGDAALATKLSGLEKSALEDKVSRLTEQLAQEAAAASKQVQELTNQNADLREQLDQAKTKNSRSQQVAGLNEQLAGLSNQVATLTARLAVAESKPSPYTPEELALLRQPSPAIPPGQHSIKELPPGAAELVRSAQQHFSNGEYAEAEADYLKILKLDENNAIALANLATIEMQEGKLDEAEKHLRTALSQTPEDAYDLSMFGFLKFRQEKYDDALDALSRAAQLDPKNPEIQNYLGVTLGQKGLRPQAEAALRKAVTLNPKYGPAHNNLALIYLSQEPSAPQLARKEYQEAIADGEERNPDLEKALAEKGAPVKFDSP